MKKAQQMDKLKLFHKPQIRKKSKFKKEHSPQRESPVISINGDIFK